MAHAVLDRLKSERQACIEFVTRTCDQAESSGRDLSDTEQETLKAQRDRIKQLDPQIAQLEEFEQLRAADAATVQHYRPTAPTGGNEQRANGNSAGNSGNARTLGVQLGDRPHEYRTVGEVIVDRIRAFDGDQRAADRLGSNQLDVPGRLGEQRAEQRASELTTDVPGLLPDKFIGEIVNEIDAARPFMESQGVGDLSDKPGLKWSRPKITQHVQVGKQTTELTALPTRKMLIGEVEFLKETAGGYVDISRQTIDWTDPSAWDAIQKDFLEQYSIETEALATAKFLESLDATGTEVAGNTTLSGWATAMYTAAAEVYGNVKVLPDVIYCSLDMWAKMGPITDTGKLIFSKGSSDAGDTRLDSFAGNLFNLPRVVVPSFTAGIIAIGRKSKFECYEQRIGFLSVAQPSVLGVQLAYGGYVANGYVSTGGFAKIVDAVAG